MHGTNYLRWNPTREVEELVIMVEPRTTESLLQDISEIESHLSGDTIRNFKSVRPFNPSGHYNTEWVQFHLDIELRTSGDVIWQKLNGLINSGILHLLAARLRRDSPYRSQLTPSIQDLLWEQDW